MTEPNDPSSGGAADQVVGTPGAPLPAAARSADPPPLVAPLDDLAWDQDDDARVFPPLLDDDDHDPLGFELATRVAADVAGILPPQRTARRRRRRPLPGGLSGPGPDERDPKALGSALGRMVRRRGWRTEIGLRRLLDSWPRLVGEVNAEHSEPIGYRDQVLQVQADSTTWATVLRQLAPTIVARLNEELGDGAVLRIEVRGPAAPSWKHGRRSVRDGRGPRDTYG